MRIDRTLDDWLVEMINSRIDDLRTRLLAVLEHELTQFTRALTDEDKMESSFDPHALEQTLYRRGTGRIFRAERQRQTVLHAIPPPNVTGCCTWAMRSTHDHGHADPLSAHEGEDAVVMAPTSGISTQMLSSGN